MAIVLSGTTNDILVNGVSVATDTEVNSAIALKANTSDVNTKLSLKANTADLNFALAGKANTIVANDSQIKTALNATGTAPIYACRAWVNFNGTGTVYIRASGNVSSITDNGVGDYTVNFTTAMPDADYSMSGVTQAVAVGGSLEGVSFKDGVSPLAGSARIITHRGGAGNIDTTYTTVTFFR